MPVEIRELVIRASVPDTDRAVTPDPASGNTVQRVESGAAASEESPQLSSAMINKMVELCLARMKDWLKEQDLR